MICGQKRAQEDTSERSRVRDRDWPFVAMPELNRSALLLLYITIP